MSNTKDIRKKSEQIYKSKNLSQPEKTMPKPEWLKIKIAHNINFQETQGIVQKYKIPTVCEEALCPNIQECWKKKHATFMILGAICTRSCAFCNVVTGKPDQLDDTEPERLAHAVKTMDLEHVVITSVDRDDLEDGGAEHFAKCITLIKTHNPNTTIEVLTPDFRNKKNALEKVVKATPDIYNHNIETVPRLYQRIRPSARYFNSLNILYKVKTINPLIPTKSGIIVGMGEDTEEILQVMDDLREADVDFITIGQYLQPTKYHWPVHKYVTPEEFKLYEKLAISKGFKMVASGPFVRSSYHAKEDFLKLKEILLQKQKINNE